MLKIIGGKLRSRKIKTIQGLETRPTLEKTRGVIFNTLQSRYHLDEYEAYDLFAGSGALGLEAISRGASKAYFLEKNRKAYSLLQKNIKELGVENQCESRCQDATQWLKSHRWNQQQNLFLLDPPYQTAFAQKVIDLLAKQQEQLKESLVVIETGKEITFTIPEGFELFQQKQLAKTRLDFLEIL